MTFRRSIDVTWTRGGRPLGALIAGRQALGSINNRGERNYAELLTSQPVDRRINFSPDPAPAAPFGGF